MQLYIVRHGIAIDREDPKCPPDPERYLTEDFESLSYCLHECNSLKRSSPAQFILISPLGGRHAGKNPERSFSDVA